MNARRLAVIAVVVFAVIQLVPVERTNPPVTGEVPAPDEVRAILDRSCGNCHSHATVWPWYAHVAPVSWLVARDVHEARRHLNFSTWDAYDLEKQQKLLSEAWDEVEEGEMPLWFYVVMHPEARLSPSDRIAFEAWARDGSDGQWGSSHDHDHDHGDDDGA